MEKAIENHAFFNDPMTRDVMLLNHNEDLSANVKQNKVKISVKAYAERV